MTEEEFQDGVIELAQAQGWRVAHFRPARTADGGWRTAVSGDGVGFPDLVLVRAPRLAFAELKGERGSVRPEQKDWLMALAACAVDVSRRPRPVPEVYLWWPADWPEIEEVLKR